MSREMRFDRENDPLLVFSKRKKQPLCDLRSHEIHARLVGGRKRASSGPQYRVRPHAPGACGSAVSKRAVTLTFAHAHAAMRALAKCAHARAFAHSRGNRP